jgi:hypothetical protein
MFSLGFFLHPGYRAGRVRALFTLPAHLSHYYPGQLAYLELFTSFDGGTSPFHGLKPTRSDFTSSGQRRTLVVPVTDIFLACHLSPNFSRLDPEVKLDARTDLFAISKSFWFNHFYSHYMYLLVRYWQAQPPPRLHLTLLERLARFNPALRPLPLLVGKHDSIYAIFRLDLYTPAAMLRANQRSTSATRPAPLVSLHWLSVVQR